MSELLNFLILLENLAPNPNGLDHRSSRLGRSPSHVENQSLERLLKDDLNFQTFGYSIRRNSFALSHPRFHIKVKQFRINYWALNIEQNTRTI